MIIKHERNGTVTTTVTRRCVTANGCLVLYDQPKNESNEDGEYVIDFENIIEQECWKFGGGDEF